MRNLRRGEIGVMLGGAPFVLRLTLGALAEIEAGFAEEGFSALFERIRTGTLVASDLVRLAGPLLRAGLGPGHDARPGFERILTERLEASDLASLLAAIEMLLAAAFPAEAADASGALFASEARASPVPPRPFPWEAVMAIGLGVLRLDPEVFWAMTLREFDAALAGASGRFSAEPSFDRARLIALMQRFPDHSPDPEACANESDR